jgi:hypothetical protein
MRRPVQRGVRRDEGGQALAEMGIVVTLITFMALGIIEFGRAWMIANVVTNAARDGARAASTLPLADRIQGGSRAGEIDTASPDWVAIQQQIRSDIASVYVDATPPQVILDTDVDPNSTVKMISVTIVDDVNWLFLGSMLGGSRFHVQRSVTFRDEGR